MRGAKLNAGIVVVDWDMIFGTSDVDVIVERFVTELFGLVPSHVLSRVITEEKKQHEWLDDECRQAIAAGGVILSKGIGRGVGVAH